MQTSYSLYKYEVSPKGRKCARPRDYRFYLYIYYDIDKTLIVKLITVNSDEPNKIIRQQIIKSKDIDNISHLFKSYTFFKNKDEVSMILRLAEDNTTKVLPLRSKYIKIRKPSSVNIIEFVSTGRYRYECSYRVRKILCFMISFHAPLKNIKDVIESYEVGMDINTFPVYIISSIINNKRYDVANYLIEKKYYRFDRYLDEVELIDEMKKVYVCRHSSYRKKQK